MQIFEAISENLYSLIKKMKDYNNRGTIKCIEIQKIKLEAIHLHRETGEKRSPLIKTTIYPTNKTELKPQEMTVLSFEYSKNWWKKQNGHFDEELYNVILFEKYPQTLLNKY